MAWKFQTGCGEALVAPLYEVLRRRGVKFEFFSKVEHLGVATDNGPVIDSIRIQRQVHLAASREGLPAAHRRQGRALLAERAAVGSDRQRRRGSRIGSRIGLDSLARRRVPERFGAVSTSITSSWRSRSVRCPRFAPSSSRRAPPGKPWSTRSRRSARRRCSSGSIGISRPSAGRRRTRRSAPASSRWTRGPTWPSSPIARPGPPTASPKGVSYFCCAMPDDPNQPSAPDAGYSATRNFSAVRETPDRLPQQAVLTVLAAQRIRRTDSTGRCSSLRRRRSGPARLDEQYLRAGIDASDRYVLSPPGSARHRLKPGESGFPEPHARRRLDGEHDQRRLHGSDGDVGPRRVARHHRISGEDSVGEEISERRDRRRDSAA